MGRDKKNAICRFTNSRTIISYNKSRLVFTISYERLIRNGVQARISAYDKSLSLVKIHLFSRYSYTLLNETSPHTPRNIIYKVRELVVIIEQKIYIYFQHLFYNRGIRQKKMFCLLDDSRLMFCLHLKSYPKEFFKKWLKSSVSATFATVLVTIWYQL